MGLEARIVALESRVRAAEDELEIIRLINTYGPLVDSGESMAAARLWVEAGIYDLGPRPSAYDEIAGMYEGELHLGLIGTGCSHMMVAPRVTVSGDEAEAVGYSMIVLREGGRWFIYRSSINHWNFVRTENGWRINERFNRVVDGSEISHATMRRVTANSLTT